MTTSLIRWRKRRNESCWTGEFGTWDEPQYRRFSVVLTGGRWLLREHPVVIEHPCASLEDGKAKAEEMARTGCDRPAPEPRYTATGNVLRLAARQSGRGMTREAALSMHRRMAAMIGELARMMIELDEAFGTCGESPKGLAPNLPPVG
jgi:hypothetical protein